MLRLLPKPKGLWPMSINSSPKKMQPSQQSSTATKMKSPRRRFLLPASTFNVPWDRVVHMTSHIAVVSFIIITSKSLLQTNYYLVNYYYNLVPMVPTVNKRFFKSFNLIRSQCNLTLKSIQVPVLLLLQPNLLHHLTDFVLNWAVFWMVWRPGNN